MNGNSEIESSLDIVDLYDNPRFVALYYTWGPPTAEAGIRGVTDVPSHPIRCNGRVILVTQNLHDFLQRVARSVELNSQNFWIDAVCINQQDLAERASQVKFMATIYRSADMVLAWLGEEDVHTEKSFTLIKGLGGLCHDYYSLDVPKMKKTENFAAVLSSLADEQVRDSFRHFWRRVYFKRAWIIQELALAKKVVAYCGGYSVEWMDIVGVSAFLTLTSWGHFLNMGVSDIVSKGHSNHTLPLYLYSNAKIQSSKEGWAFLYTLTRGREFQSSDPRDKVYALLGLQEHYTKDKPRLRPTYGEFSVVATFTKAAIQILEDTDDLLLLGHGEGKDFQRVKGLPSWVPDWSCTKILGLGMIGYKRFAAAGNLPRSLGIDEPNTALILRGFCLDLVAQIGESKEEALTRRGPAFFSQMDGDSINSSRHLSHKTIQV
ncbi:hypothetical protein AWENTII_000684 [Aspergillus wentii]